MTEWDELELVKRAQQGDGGAFGELYERYLERVYRYVLLRVSIREVAEDLAEQTFLKAFEGLPSYRWQPPSIAPWLFRIAHNVVIDHARQGQRRPTVPLEEAITSHPDQAVDDAVASTLGWQELSSALAHLTEAQRQVILMKFSSDLSNEEVARALGKTVGAVKDLQHKALRALRKYLNADDRDD